MTKPSPLLLLSLIIPLALFGANASAAPGSAGEVTAQQVATMKDGMDGSCRDAGKKHGDAAPHVEAVCGCLRRVLEENVTMDNWRQAVFEDSRGNQPEVQKLLIAPNADKLRACAALP